LHFYLVWLAASSVILFILYGIDKAQAKNRGWHVPEVTLHVMALAGGFIGGWLGRSLFHHKTKKGIFLFVLVASTILHAAIIWWMICG
jgi:uncharacterized membrane protein YsdA (DUF1294 family)